MLAFFLPGIATLLAKALTPALAASVGCGGDAASVSGTARLLDFVICETIGGEAPPDDAGGTAEDDALGKLHALVLRASEAPAPAPTPEPPTHEFAVARTREWLATARVRVGPVLCKSLFALCEAHDLPARAGVVQAAASLVSQCPWLLARPETRDVAVDAALHAAPDAPAEMARALRGVALPAVIARHLVRLHDDVAVHGDTVVKIHAQHVVSAIATASAGPGARSLLQATVNDTADSSWLARFAGAPLLAALLDACAHAIKPDCSALLTPQTMIGAPPAPLAPVTMRHVTVRGHAAVRELTVAVAAALAPDDLLDVVDALHVAQSRRWPMQTRFARV